MPLLVTLATFLTYIHIDPVNNKITAEKVNNSVILIIDKRVCVYITIIVVIIIVVIIVVIINNFLIYKKRCLLALPSSTSSAFPSSSSPLSFSELSRFLLHINLNYDWEDVFDDVCIGEPIVHNNDDNTLSSAGSEPSPALSFPRCWGTQWADTGWQRTKGHQNFQTFCIHILHRRMKEWVTIIKLSVSTTPPLDGTHAGVFIANNVWRQNSLYLEIQSCRGWPPTWRKGNWLVWWERSFAFIFRNDTGMKSQLFWFRTQRVNFYRWVSKLEIWLVF